MNKYVLLIIALLLLVLGGECRAYEPAIIGGIRNGAALGLMFESGTTNDIKLRLGFEANTSNTPILVCVGGKWFLTDVGGGYPMFLSGGLVGDLGNNAAAGPYLSVIFGQFLNVTPLFLELGVDVVKSGRLQFQAGYYF